MKDSGKVLLVPVYWIIDTSESMEGSPIETVREALRHFALDLKKLDTHSVHFFVSVLTFDANAKRVCKLTPIKALQQPQLVIGEGAEMGKALELLSIRMQSDFSAMTDKGAGFGLPQVFLFTRGLTTSDWQDSAALINGLPMNLVVCAVDPDPAMDGLRTLANLLVHIKSDHPQGYARLAQVILGSVDYMSILQARCDDTKRQLEEQASLTRKLTDKLEAADRGHNVCYSHAQDWMMGVLPLPQNIKEDVEAAADLVRDLRRQAQDTANELEKLESARNSALRQLKEIEEQRCMMHRIAEETANELEKLRSGRDLALAQLQEIEQRSNEMHLSAKVIECYRPGLKFAAPMSRRDSNILQSPSCTKEKVSSRESRFPNAPLDSVHFSISSPESMAHGTAHLLDFWAFLGDQRQEMERRARQEAYGRRVRIKGSGPVAIQRHAQLTVRMQVEDLLIRPARGTVLWGGEVGNATFSAQVREDASAGAKNGCARVYLAQLLVARVLFQVQVGIDEPEIHQAEASARRYKSVFASYASADRKAVMARVQGIMKAAPNLNIFVDVANLHAGERWKDRLREEILARDVLYLFWSEAASRSEWVEREWRCALENKGIDFIEPVPMVSPDVVPPPSELSGALHFSDWMLPYL